MATNNISKLLLSSRGIIVRKFSTTVELTQKKYDLLVIGGGTGGCSISNKFSSKLGRGNVGVIEPNEIHYYQPMWTLVGGGVKKFKNTAMPMAAVLPDKADWIKASVVKFNPEKNQVTTSDGETISYNYLVIAMGMQLNYGDIKGLVEALKNDDRVCSNYSPVYVQKTYPALLNFQGGNAIFTFPNTPIKCAGAPQKIMYLAEEIFRKNGKRDNTKVIFNTSLGVIFGVKKYADRLSEIIQKRNIEVNFKTNLIEVKPETSEAVFENLDTKETKTFKYDFIHATPPMSAPDVLRQSSLVNEAGFLDVRKDTLQHTKYPNIFGIGDCTSLPTSKTAAAVAAQSGTLRKNLQALMDGRDLKAQYDGYTSCPLITGRGKCILAEFDYDAQPLETFPIDQGKERWTMYHMKKDVMPPIYWQVLLKGFWEGPRIFRKLMKFGMGK